MGNGLRTDSIATTNNAKLTPAQALGLEKSNEVLKKTLPADWLQKAIEKDSNKTQPNVTKPTKAQKKDVNKFIEIFKNMSPKDKAAWNRFMNNDNMTENGKRILDYFKNNGTPQHIRPQSLTGGHYDLKV